jgi:hypothetical protein
VTLCDDEGDEDGSLTTHDASGSDAPVCQKVNYQINDTEEHIFSVLAPNCSDSGDGVTTWQTRNELDSSRNTTDNVRNDGNALKLSVRFLN